MDNQNQPPKLYTIEEFLDSLKTPRGGYTRDTLAQLGVSWPPKKGWKSELIKWYKSQK